MTPYCFKRTALSRLQEVELAHWYMLGFTVIVLFERSTAMIAEVDVEVVRRGPVTVNWRFAVPWDNLELAVPEWRTKLLI